VRQFDQTLGANKGESGKQRSEHHPETQLQHEFAVIVFTQKT